MIMKWIWVLLRMVRYNKLLCHLKKIILQSIKAPIISLNHWQHVYSVITFFKIFFCSFMKGILFWEPLVAITDSVIDLLTTHILVRHMVLTLVLSWTSQGIIMWLAGCPQMQCTISWKEFCITVSKKPWKYWYLKSN